MNIDVSALQRIAERLYVTEVSRDMGTVGTVLLPPLIRGIRAVHAAVTTERLSAGLRIAVSVEESSIWRPGAYASIPKALDLTPRHRGGVALDIQLRNDGSLLIWTGQNEPVEPSDGFLVYEYLAASQEYLITPKARHDLPSVAGHPSYFSVPYFRDLHDALTHYGEVVVWDCDCDELARCWLDDDRLVFSPGPERHMRRSMQRYLRLTLRDHQAVEIMPEQNINETRPVDIKVTWTGSNRVALIEIKWLGISVNRDSGTVTARHSESRAQEGARQLSNYLDSYGEQSRFQERRGYLTVFDGRRRSVNPSTAAIDEADALFFQQREISYDPTILARDDFEVPLRLFCRPRVR